MAFKKKLIVVLVLMVSGMMVFLTGCSQDSQESANLEELEIQGQYFDDPIYNYYNQVELNQTKQEVDSRLGVQPEIDEMGMLNYIDPETGYGVFVSFGEGDLVETKSIYIPEGAEKIRNLSKADVSEEKLAEITAGMGYDEVINRLGSGGVEIVCTTNPDSEENPYYAMGWLNENGSVALVYFEGLEGSVYESEFVNGN